MNLEQLRNDISRPGPISWRDVMVVIKYYNTKSNAELEGISHTLAYRKTLTKFDKVRKKAIKQIIKCRNSREF